MLTVRSFSELTKSTSGVEDVAEEVVRFDEVVAGAEVAVMLERHARAAGRGEDADRPCHPASAQSKFRTILIRSSADLVPLHRLEALKTGNGPVSGVIDHARRKNRSSSYPEPLRHSPLLQGTPSTPPR